MEQYAANDRDDAAGEARRWITRLASAAVATEDLAQLHAWLDADDAHRAAFQRERRTWQDLAAIEDAFAADALAMAPAHRPLRAFGPVHAGLAVAAGLAAIIAIPAAWLWLQADYRSPATRPQAIALADGSRAILDADSAVSVAFDSGGRLVTLLEGRVWFDVRHDRRPFRVLARDGVIQDVGTAFAVDRTDDAVRVGVTQGLVRVTTKQGGSLLLSAGNQARYRTGEPARRSANTDPATIAAWRNDELLFRATPLPAAIDAIARYRAAPVYVWGDLSALAPVSGSFRASRADDALATLVVMRGLDTIRLPGGILIVRAGTADK
ncbi:FecR domain-containing protein [Sphingomonas sp. 4RDLI-65]|uniref:FecR family protein n=1 Tax=Sphingomonas sp. 4RDLI-65 TaxID=3111641 RepID=UPI003C29C39E